MEEIGAIVNEDVDFVSMGLMWTVDPEQHWAMKRDEQAASSSALNWVAAGMTPQAAAYLLGITEERFPNELITKYGIWRVTEEPEPESQTDPTDIGGASPVAEDMDGEESDDSMKALEAGQFRRWLKKRTNPDPAQFKALYLSDSDKRMIMESEPEPESVDTGDDMKAAFFETLAKVEAALVA
jgi:hypothetical protein